MGETHNQGYELNWSQDLAEQLKSEKAIGFRNHILLFVLEAYNAFLLHSNSSEILKISQAKINTSILGCALDSALLDLMQADVFHDLKDGPNSSKVGAALTCWLNRFKPIQLPELVKDPKLEPEVPMLNAMFALEVGWAFKWCLDEQERNPNVPVSVAVKHLHDVIKERQTANNLVYTLMWRNPGFKELATLFEFM